MAITTSSSPPRTKILGFGWLAWATYHLFSLETVLVLFLHARSLKAVLPSTPVPETLFYGALSVAIGSWLILRDGLYRRGLPIVIAGLAFTGWVVVSYGWSPSTTLARENLPFILAINLWAVLVAACVVAGSRERVMRFLMLLVLLTAALAFIGVYIYFAYGSFRFYRGANNDWEGRTYLDWGNIVATGAAISIAIAAYVRFGSLKQFLFVSVVCASFFFVLISGARGATVAIVATGIFALISDMPRIRDGRFLVAKAQLAFFALLALLVGYVVYLLASGQSTSTLGRLLRLFDEAGDPLLRTGPNRFDYFMGAYRAWIDAPLLGQGLYGFSTFFCGADAEGCYPHNAILHVLADFGLIGLVLFLVFMFSGIRHLSPSRLRHDPLMFALAMGFLTVIVNVMTASDTTTNFRLFLFLGLLALRPPSIASDGEEAEEEDPMTI